jgi:hypothetical protein
MKKLLLSLIISLVTIMTFCQTQTIVNHKDYIEIVQSTTPPLVTSVRKSDVIKIEEIASDIFLYISADDRIQLSHSNFSNSYATISLFKSAITDLIYNSSSGIGIDPISSEKAFFGVFSNDTIDVSLEDEIYKLSVYGIDSIKIVTDSVQLIDSTWIVGGTLPSGVGYNFGLGLNYIDDMTFIFFTNGGVFSGLKKEDE